MNTPPADRGSGYGSFVPNSGRFSEAQNEPKRARGESSRVANGAMPRTSMGLFEGGVEYMGLSRNWGVPSKTCGGSRGASTEVAPETRNRAGSTGRACERPGQSCLKTLVREVRSRNTHRRRGGGRSKEERGTTMRIERRHTTDGQSPYAQIDFRLTTSEIRNPDGSVVFRLENVEVPEFWSQVASTCWRRSISAKPASPRA